jgi:hypothetical protein
MARFLWTVYRTTCLVNTHFYFGIHKTTDPDDEYLGSGTVFLRAVAKYGRENFKKEVLFIFENRVPACAKERELISGVLGDPRCYNLAIGGEAGWEYANRNGVVAKHWKDHREARSKAISAAVTKKWADLDHHRLHAEANGSPRARERQSAGHTKQWANMNAEFYSLVCAKRAVKAKENWEKCKTALAAALKKCDDEALQEALLQNPQLTCQELQTKLKISYPTLRRACRRIGYRWNRTANGFINDR